MALRRPGAIVTSALDYYSAFDDINNVFTDTRNDTKNAEDNGIEKSVRYCDVKSLYRQPFVFISRAWENAQAAHKMKDQKGESRPNNSQRLPRLANRKHLLEPAW